MVLFVFQRLDTVKLVDIVQTTRGATEIGWHEYHVDMTRTTRWSTTPTRQQVLLFPLPRFSLVRQTFKLQQPSLYNRLEDNDSKKTRCDRRWRRAWKRMVCRYIFSCDVFQNNEIRAASNANFPFPPCLLKGSTNSHVKTFPRSQRSFLHYFQRSKVDGFCGEWQFSLSRRQ